MVNKLLTLMNCYIIKIITTNLYPSEENNSKLLTISTLHSQSNFYLTHAQSHMIVSIILTAFPYIGNIDGVPLITG